MKRMILTICSILFLLIGGCAIKSDRPIQPLVESQLDFEPASPFHDSRSKFPGDQGYWQDTIQKTMRVTQLPGQ